MALDSLSKRRGAPKGVLAMLGLKPHAESFNPFGVEAEHTGAFANSRHKPTTLGLYRFPRLACSRSSASNNALKLPAPKPLLPWRRITS